MGVNKFEVIIVIIEFIKKKLTICKFDDNIKYNMNVFKRMSMYVVLIEFNPQQFYYTKRIQ